LLRLYPSPDDPKEMADAIRYAEQKDAVGWKLRVSGECAREKMQMMAEGRGPAVGDVSFSLSASNTTQAGSNIGGDEEGAENGLRRIPRKGPGVYTGKERDLFQKGYDAIFGK